MTQTAAICEALLKGEVLSIMTGFKMFNCSNLPREISRSVEKKFGVIISRVRQDFISQYGQRHGYYYQYRLNKKIECNQIGIQRMRDYVKIQLGKSNEAKTDKQKKLFKQQELFINSI